MPVQEVSKDLRRKAKAVNFGIVYGISAYSLSEDFGVSVKEAEEYMEKYFESYPDVRRYLDETIAFAKENGYVKTLYGRIRPIPELSSDHYALRQFGVRVAMNSPIQGTAADIMKIAVIRVNDALRKAGLRTKTVLQIHDEILLEAPLSEADEAEAILVREMESASDLKAPLKAEANRGRSWYEAK